MALWPILLVLTIASWIDIRTRRVPNWITIPFLLAGFASQAIFSGPPGIWRACAGLVLAVAIYGVPCFFRAMGMGDLKLAAGVAAWIGPGQFLTASVLTAILGGVMAVVYSLWRGTLAGALERTGDLLKLQAQAGPGMGSDAARAQSIPYAPAIAAGALLSFFAK